MAAFLFARGMRSEAQAAIEGANGSKLLDQTLTVDFAFVRPPPGKAQQQRGGKTGPAKGARARSRSPMDAKEQDDRDEGL